MEHEEITERIIAAAIAVHKGLGPGFLESIYEMALAVELRTRAIAFERQIPVPVLYRELEVGLHRLDLLVEREIVVELKAIKSLEAIHFAIARSYLRAAGRIHGLIFNFAKPTLEIKRVSARCSFPGFLAS